LQADSVNFHIGVFKEAKYGKGLGDLKWRLQSVYGFTEWSVCYKEQIHYQSSHITIGNGLDYFETRSSGRK